jgi:hydroxymethylglutaryl-CoA lyase
VLTLPERVDIREVGPRDGLQNEDPVPVEARVRLVDALSRTGVRRIETGSFVRPDAVPPMAGSEEVFERVARVPGVRYCALVPNAKGAERALAASANEIDVVVSASETHNQANVRRSVDESVSEIRRVVDLAGEHTTPVEAVISTAFGCPYEGDVEPARVSALARRLLDDAGVDTVCLGDTTGMATPGRVEAVLDALGAAGVAPDAVGMHFHDTRGTGLANALAALERGVVRFDASVGGLGGCPYAPGASGNIATEDLVHMLEDMGVDTGIDLDALLAAARLAEELVGRTLPGQILRAGPRTRLATRA